jgi:hypothetical protein
MNDFRTDVRQGMAAINKAWRSGHVRDMTRYIHPDFVMKLPKFSGEVVGRDALLAGFEEFCTNARVIEYSESDYQIDTAGDCAVVSFRFNMLYERTKYRERSTGRDLWVFLRESGHWLAVWRTMTDVSELREQK